MSPRFSSGGFNTFDLLDDLSPFERTLTRLFLRHAEMTEESLHQTISALPVHKRMNKAEITATLKSLGEKGWVQEKQIGLKKTYLLKQQNHRQ